MAKKYWLFKSEPNTYSIDDLKRDQKTYWEGVRNYQANNNMKNMDINDLAFFYHSNKEKAVKGLVKIIKKHYPDHTDPTQRFGMVDVKYYKCLRHHVTLKNIKANPQFSDIALDHYEMENNYNVNIINIPPCSGTVSNLCMELSCPNLSHKGPIISKYYFLDDHD